MTNYIQFRVFGIPRPGGSKRAFAIPGTKKIVITEDCKKSKDWRTSVAWAAKEVISEPLMGPLHVRFTFSLLRPRSHYGSGKNREQIKQSAPTWPAVRPDCSKLVRSTEDALKGIAWNDDSQIVIQWVQKQYATPGCFIEIRRLEEE